MPRQANIFVWLPCVLACNSPSSEFCMSSASHSCPSCNPQFSPPRITARIRRHSYQKHSFCWWIQHVVHRGRRHSNDRHVDAPAPGHDDAGDCGSSSSAGLDVLVPWDWDEADAFDVAVASTRGATTTRLLRRHGGGGAWCC